MDTEVRNDGDVENGNYFLKLLRAETERLEALVSSAEHDLETDESIPEDARGKLRIATGKAKMLLNNKFARFEELCNKNLGMTSNVRYTVTSEDLAGYWETTVLQIIQVHKIFEGVDILRKNNWEEPPIKLNHRKQEDKTGRKLEGSKMGKVVSQTPINSEVA